MSGFASTLRAAFEAVVGLAVCATLGLVLVLVLHEPARAPCPCVEGSVECEGCARVRVKLSRGQPVSPFDWCRACDDADYAAVHAALPIEVGR